jgi:hypothetical protein
VLACRLMRGTPWCQEKTGSSPPHKYTRIPRPGPTRQTATNLSTTNTAALCEALRMGISRQLLLQCKLHAGSMLVLSPSLQLFESCVWVRQRVLRVVVDHDFCQRQHAVSYHTKAPTQLCVSCVRGKVMVLSIVVGHHFRHNKTLSVWFTTSHPRYCLPAGLPIC